MDLVIRPSYGDGSYKQDGRDGNDGGEGTCSSYGSQRVSRSHGGSVASGGSAAIGDHEEHGANIGNGRRVKVNGGKGVSGTNEESGAFELSEGENYSETAETDGQGLERLTSQDFEHQQEVIHHLKRRMNSSPCKCVFSCDISHFQSFHIFLTSIPKP